MARYSPLVLKAPLNSSEPNNLTYFGTQRAQPTSPIHFLALPRRIGGYPSPEAQQTVQWGC